MKNNILQIMENNDGALDRKSINKNLLDMIDDGLVKVRFKKEGPPRTITDHTEYNYVITDKGREVLAAAKRRKYRRMGV